MFLNLYGIRYIIRKHQKKGVAFTGSIPRRRAEKRGETYDVAELLGKGGLVSQAVRKGIPLFGSVFGLFCIFLYFVYALDEYSVFRVLREPVAIICLIVEIIAIAWFTIFFREQGDSHTYELELFWSYRKWILEGSVTFGLEILNNIVLFFPFGFIRRMLFGDVRFGRFFWHQVRSAGVLSSVSLYSSLVCLNSTIFLTMCLAQWPMVCFPYSQKSEAQETRRPLQSLLILARVKQCIPISGKCAVQDHAKDSTANEFADSDRERQKWERECYPISVAEDKRYDQRIREDRRQRQQERVLVPHPVYEDSSNQCCETAEDNIRQDRASEDVADQTPDEETRYSGWGESGEKL